MNRLVRLGAVGAVAGGALRVAAAFIPYTAAAWLEALYAVIDVGLLLGLLGVHAAAAERIGTAGFAAFVVALLALASIVGPDAQRFGIDFYQAGAGVHVIALAGFAVALYAAGTQRTAAALWIASALLGVGSVIAGVPIATTAAGVALGAGFVFAGLEAMRFRHV
jgi:hypothetical protein